jgi:hypothetical protein
MNEPGSSTY